MCATVATEVEATIRLELAVTAHTNALAPRLTREFAAGTAESPPAKRLITVVGYDGTPPARHALDQAVDLLRYREGALEVVYVAHVPLDVAYAPELLPEVKQGLDDQARALAEEVRHRLAGENHPWHFHRRDGAVPAELEAVADDVQRRYGDTAEIVIVMGASAHHHHHLPGSVGSRVVRSQTFPALVVP